jgi:hypothetical protein
MIFISLAKSYNYKFSFHIFFSQTFVCWSRPATTPVNERLCNFCNVLEDEYHFIIECKLYDELRHKYILSKYWRRPNMYKFIDLMNNENQMIVRMLGTFMHTAFKKRNEILYGN